MARSSVLVCLLLGISFCGVSETAKVGEVCTTPNGETATCLSIYSCKVLLDAVLRTDRTTIDFLRASQCGYETNPLVCCGTTAALGTVVPKIPTPEGRIKPAGPNKAIATIEECGEMESTDKLLGATATNIDEFPWMALLQYTRKSNGGDIFLCGGSLIGHRYILTAAHCVIGKINNRYTLKNIRLGEWDTRSEPDCVPTVGGGQDCADASVTVDVEEVIPHASYDDTTLSRHNDIALIRLSRSVGYTDFIKPICLPTASDVTPDGKNLTVAGWGKTETEDFSPVKLRLRLPKTAQSKCRETFSRGRVAIADTQFCAGGLHNQDSCTGDSGGPLMSNFVANPLKWYVEGLVSFGTTCGQEGWPGVYTKVSSYLDWIRKNVRD